jgi:heme/copper-type cytochrome/quinol oxidase subunit 3
MFSEKDAFFTKLFIASYIFATLFIFYTIVEIKKKIWPKPRSKVLLSALANTVTTIANITTPPDLNKRG